MGLHFRQSIQWKKWICNFNVNRSFQQIPSKVEISTQKKKYIQICGHFWEYCTIFWAQKISHLYKNLGNRLWYSSAPSTDIKYFPICRNGTRRCIWLNLLNRHWSSRQNWQICFYNFLAQRAYTCNTQSKLLCCSNNNKAMHWWAHQLKASFRKNHGLREFLSVTN